MTNIVRSHGEDVWWSKPVLQALPCRFQPTALGLWAGLAASMFANSRKHDPLVASKCSHKPLQLSSPVDLCPRQVPYPDAGTAPQPIHNADANVRPSAPLSLGGRAERRQGKTSEETRPCKTLTPASRLLRCGHFGSISQLAQKQHSSEHHRPSTRQRTCLRRGQYRLHIMIQ
ncbi:uncharacterized protein B0I36DRAFT_391608 [Microdochium trichocladiopsis]|uniref:Uncharacterized protein n=1 Tax=Microdochium trichocladiopsis TaxID=1682393 RepID=A0A9P8YI93_9PEZI|nr:uncharacterized protein B0I36DRAFT_391608 [Microdochium trichocladiopsis]KAH7040775.1 hypothetical protein B0I36DRAFT_391608 [Microdochium trichocladiopsis]